MSALHSGRMSAFVRQCAKYPLSRPTNVACGWDLRSCLSTDGPTYPVLPVINIFISAMFHRECSAHRDFPLGRGLATNQPKIFGRLTDRPSLREWVRQTCRPILECKRPA